MQLAELLLKDLGVRVLGTLLLPQHEIVRRNSLIYSRAREMKFKSSRLLFVKRVLKSFEAPSSELK